MFDKEQMEFEILDSKIAQGIMKIIQARFQKQDQLLAEDSLQEPMSNVLQAGKSCIRSSRSSQHQSNSGAHDELE